MNPIATLVGVVSLLMSTAAWPAVVVQESPVSEQPKTNINILSEGSFTSGQIGRMPPKPWRCSKSTEKARVTMETPTSRPEAERWVRLVDDDDTENANLRQSFAPVTSGCFRARLISNKDGGRLYFNLGVGAASKPEERAVQLSIDADGSLVVRSAQKSKTTMQIKAGGVYLVRCDFEPVKDGKALRILAELVEENTQRQSRVETEVETQLAVATVRVTSTRADTGVDFYATDVSLTGR
jgi:hypothetical protein